MEYTPSLKTKYKEEIVPALHKEFGYKSVMQVPTLKKIVLNQGVGKAVADKKLLESAEKQLTTIAGQKAVKTLSKKDISNFKLRKKVPIGVRVTLRKRGKTSYPLVRILGASARDSSDWAGYESAGILWFIPMNAYK